MYHTLDICQDIALKLNQPERVLETVQESMRRGLFIANDWPEVTLAHGFPGIACFYEALNQMNPNESWDQIAHAYLKLAVNLAENQGIQSCSLYEGLAGLCFAIYSCSNNGSRYQSLLNRLEDMLVREIEYSFIREGDVLLTKNLDVPPQFYNLAYGLSGIIAYLLLRKNNPTLHRLAHNCLSQLVMLLKRKRVVQGLQVPGWYVSENPSHLPSGGFILMMNFGITGVLSLLSIATLEGVVVPGQIELIQEMASWLKAKQRHSPYGPVWHHTVSLEEEISAPKELEELTRDIWDYGTPSVSRSLYLAAKASKDQSLQAYAEETFCTIFSKTWQDRNLMGPSFNWGRAGLLSLTYHMAQDTQNLKLLKEVDILETDLKRFYSPSHPFGFQTIHTPQLDEYRWVDHPGLLDGATGVILSLMNVQAKQGMNWPRLFLLT